MVSCDPITLEKVRAEIWLGEGQLVAKTPFVKNFSVSKARGQLSNTFSATVEVKADTKFSLGQGLIIRAGTKGNLKRVFYGDITGIQVNPAFGMMGYVSISLSGSGIMTRLENKKFSRRLDPKGQGLFCTINNGAANRPEKYYSLDKPVSAGNHKYVSNTVSPGKISGENSPLVVYNSSQREPATAGKPISMAGDPTGGGNKPSGGEGLGRHDHSSDDEGGPAFAVYSVD